MESNLESYKNSFSGKLSRYFVYNRQVAFILFFGAILWGVGAFLNLPQRKDPEIPVRVAAAVIPWPGVEAEKIEQMVTRQVEAKVFENAKVDKIESLSKTHVAIVTIELQDTVKETGKEFDDIKFKLDSLALPEGAGPIQFIKDFGDTAALMLTVANPRVDESVQIGLAGVLEREIIKIRASAKNQTHRKTLAYFFPPPRDNNLILKPLAMVKQFLEDQKLAEDVISFEVSGFAAIDMSSEIKRDVLIKRLHEFATDNLQGSQVFLDVWPAVYVDSPSDCVNEIKRVAGSKYSYRNMDQFTEILEKDLKSLPQVAKVSRVGLQPEKIYLYYSQERLAAFGLRPSEIPSVFKGRNIVPVGGMINTTGRTLTIEPSGEFLNEQEIGNTVVRLSQSGTPLYARDLFDIIRGYDEPPQFLNFFSKKTSNGSWQRLPAITIAVQMRTGEQISAFGSAVSELLEQSRRKLPSDLIIERTSDQPLQVRENINLFMQCLGEAVVLVVIVSLIGFWDFATAFLLALTMPLTLAMTFGLMQLLKIDVQQVSVASLIIALGLLVDVPVVAGDSIKRLLGSGYSSITAAWLGPTKLSVPMIFATLTNVVAYLPFLLLSGGTGEFLYSLPLVITCSLISANFAALTFVPLLGYFLLTPQPEKTAAELKKGGFYGFYSKILSWVIHNRWTTLAFSLVLLFPGFLAMGQLKQQFFPNDLQYLSYLDVWLPNDAPLGSTDEIARKAEVVIRNTAEEFGKSKPAVNGKPPEVLVCLTSFVGGGGPRFWFSVSPELAQSNYAQIVIQVNDKHDTEPLLKMVQEKLSTTITGARFDVRQLETGEPVGAPVGIRIVGPDVKTLRVLGLQATKIFQSSNMSARVRDSWGGDKLTVKYEIDDQRANLSGISNRDVAGASGMGLSGISITSFRDKDRTIPVVGKLRLEERARLSDLESLYVYSTRGTTKVPLIQAANISYLPVQDRIRRRNQFRTITVSCFPVDGILPSQVMGELQPKIQEFERSLPFGYHVEIAGEAEKQVKGFGELAVVLLISVTAIYLALVFQFSNAIKPFIVFAAIPYGVAGAMLGLWYMGAPFGFMAFLGVASLIGVIVSHIIVLFDFIEEAREEGRPLEEALLDAGIMRLRPVIITVAATLFALFPLAEHGGPLWEPLCYAQIGGLGVATLVTLVLVPVLYSIFVMDLGLISWSVDAHESDGGHAEPHADEKHTEKK
ncbi:MAG: efflux RND transporter permease subunit [Candidatus Ozemobacteraceae bacterium]